MMTQELNGICSVCGNKYHVCQICEQRKGQWESWKLITDTSEHYQIFVILRDYDSKRITKGQAKELLSSYDLSQKETWNPSIKKILNKIFAEQKKKKISNVDLESDVI